MTRILLTGGGTGGHVYPLIAITRQLKKIAVQEGREIDLQYFGPRDIFSFYLLGEGITVKKITSSKIRRYFSFLNFLDGPRFIWSVLQSLIKVFWFMPDVAFSKGGPSSLSVLLACRFYRIPVVIHESDAIPGLNSQIASQHAKIVQLGFASATNYFKSVTKAIIKVVGNPVLEEILVPADQVESKNSFGLNATKKVLLVMGGSQGATRINDFIYNNLETLLAKYQIIHQVGTQNYYEYLGRFEKLPSGYVVVAYLENNLPQAYGAADVVLARAGAQTIFELAAVGRPAILVPLPEAAQDHQRQNAYEYAKTGAAVVIEQENLLINLVEMEVEQILNSDKWQQMSQAAKNFYKPEAAFTIAKDVLNTAML